MRRMALSLTMMSCLTVAHAMESPVRSEMNECSVHKVEDSPPCLMLNSPIPSSREESKETLLDMAVLGIESYTNKMPQSDRASFYFSTILQQKDAVKAANPKSVALAHYYLGKMGARGEVRLCPTNNEPEEFECAYKYLKNAATQKADPPVAAQALLMMARMNYVRGISDKNTTMVENAIAGCYQVVNDGHDEASALTAKLLLSDAARFGNGLKRDGDVALQYAQEVADQQKYMRESLKGCLLCASLYMEGIETDSWDFERCGYAQAYLIRPRLQSQFEDLRSKAETLYAALQAKVQACRYQEGLAYIRRALAVHGCHGAGPFWNALEKRNIKTLKELKTQAPTDYAYMLQQAEHCFEQAAYENHNPDIKAAAREKLALIYNETGRPNKFQEIEKAIKKAKAYAANQYIEIQ